MVLARSSRKNGTQNPAGGGNEVGLRSRYEKRKLGGLGGPDCAKMRIPPAGLARAAEVGLSRVACSPSRATAVRDSCPQRTQTSPCLVARALEFTRPTLAGLSLHRVLRCYRSAARVDHDAVTGKSIRAPSSHVWQYHSVGKGVQNKINRMCTGRRK